MLLKFAGVWNTIEGVVRAISFVSSLMVSFTDNYWFMLGPAVQIAIGLYLFLGGKWIANLAIPGNRPYCHECGYDLTGATGDRCNECGTAFRTEGASHGARDHI